MTTTEFAGHTAPPILVRDAGEADMAVYKDQMAEVERDLARGTISAEEAQRLRAEVGRRLLDLDRQRAPGAATSAAPTTPVAALPS